MIQPPFLTGEKVCLRALTSDDINERYLSWLNDPHILRFRGAKGFPSRREDLERYFDTISDQNTLVLGIVRRETSVHVGNIALAHILWIHRSAELNIMIGEREALGTGCGRDAIACLVRHGFQAMGLKRIWAESPNPAFNRAVAGLGWTREGVKRQAFFLEGEFVDIECWSILADEMKDGLTE